jgi:glutaredoxin
MKQACTVWSLYFSGAAAVILYPAVLAFLAYKGRWPAFVLLLVFLPCARWASLRFFPRISKWRGYGSVDDNLPASVEKAPVEVTYYSLLGCPFCPIVAGRLGALQKEMGFTLTRVDLTLEPQLAVSKGIRSVPVVEVGKERLVGNATTERLAQLITHAQVA